MSSLIPIDRIAEYTDQYITFKPPETTRVDVFLKKYLTLYQNYQRGIFSISSPGLYKEPAGITLENFKITSDRHEKTYYDLINYQKYRNIMISLSSGLASSRPGTYLDVYI